MSDNADIYRERIYNARQRRVTIFLYVAKFWHDYGLSPTVKEIAEGCNLPKSAVKYHLDKLIKKGCITQYAKRSRSIKIAGEIKPGAKLPPLPSETPEKKLNMKYQVLDSKSQNIIENIMSDIISTEEAAIDRILINLSDFVGKHYLHLPVRDNGYADVNRAVIVGLIDYLTEKIDKK